MLLGAPVAAALGCRSGPRGLPPGTLLDTGRTRGHAAIRDGTLPAVAADRWRRARVVIAGAGAAGLGAAWALRRSGVPDVIVLELDDVIGGTSRGEDGAVTPAPWGAHYIVAPQAHQAELIALLTDMDAIESWAADGTPIVAEALRCRDPEERVFHRGRWYPGLYLEAGASPEDLAQRDRFEAEIERWAAWRDPAGRRAFTLPVSACSAGEEPAALDRLSFADWLDQRELRSPRLRWLCDYACRDDYGLTAAGTSAWAGVFYFAARIAAPGVEPQTVVTWPDGNHALIRALAAGVPIETRVAVVDVRAAERGVEVVAIGPDGVFGIRADHAIVATPRHVARRIVAPLRDVPEPAIETAPWAVANLHLRGRPRERAGAAPAWDNVLRESPSLGYVSATHQRGRDVGPTVWTWYYPFTDLDAAATRRRLEGAGRDEWAEVALADLSRAHPALRDLVTRVDVAFWGHGMARPTVGAMFGGARASRPAAIGPIHFAHTDLSGIALFEEAFDHGLRAAREVVAGPGAPA
jgi:hypothetical protein